jgi:ATP/maltotriose-dependent transcriptional regulator MalT
MWLAAGMTDKAGTAIDRANQALEANGQRYAEGLVRLLRARLLRARGEPVDVVRAAAEEARAWSTDREAHLFARRAQEFLAELDLHPVPRRLKITATSSSDSNRNEESTPNGPPADHPQSSDGSTSTRR